MIYCTNSFGPQIIASGCCVTGLSPTGYDSVVLSWQHAAMSPLYFCSNMLRVYWQSAQHATRHVGGGRAAGSCEMGLLDADSAVFTSTGLVHEAANHMGGGETSNTVEWGS
jgi:hypothetical protein